MRFRAGPVLVLALAAASAVSQESGLAWTPEPGRYSSARVQAVLPPGATGEYRFQESGDGIWRPLSGALELTAFPREERTYVLEVRGARGTERFEGQARYVIDRLPPPAPVLSPPPGSYEGPREIRLASEPGAAIYYSLEASNRPSRGFVPFDPARPPAIDRPPDGTRSWTLSAYAVDPAGNPGPIATARYVVEPAPTGPRDPGVGDSGNPPMGTGAEAKHRIERKAPGSAAVLFEVAEGVRMYAAVNPRDPSDPACYVELPAPGGTAALELSAPAGWVGPLAVYYALREDGRLARAPEALEVRFTFEDPGKAPPSPSEPTVLYPPGTRTALVSWGPSPFRIEVSVGTGSFSPYSLPISLPLPEGAEGVRIRYRAVGPSGTASEERSLILAAPTRPGLPDISGLPEGGRTARAVLPRSAPGTVVRYEAATEGFPPAVSASSPRLDESVSFAGEPGRDVRYTLRFRAFADPSPESAGSDERFASFTVDRSPPTVPRLAAGSLAGDTEEDRVIAFEPGEGTILFAAVESGSPPEGKFQEYSGPVTLEGSGDRPRAYDVYAYATDEAGNRSETLGPVSVRIDRASVYVAPWGSDSAGGGPRNPLATVAAGVEAAAATGRRFVRVQGDVDLGGPIRARAEVEILGACDDSWEPVPGHRSAIGASGIPGPWFIAQGATLILRNLAVDVDAPGDFTLAEISEGNLEASNLNVRIRAGGELVVFRARDSIVDLAGSDVEISGALFARVLEAAGGGTRIRDLGLRAEDSLTYLTAFSFAGGTADLSRIRSQTRTSGGFTFARGVGARIEIRESYLRSRGTGFSETFRLESSRTALYTVSSDAECRGPLTFASVEGGRTDILHSTFALRGGPLLFLDLRSASLRLGNSIVQDASGEGVFLRTDEAPQKGGVVRNALSGFRTYVAGAGTAATVDALNRLAAPPDGFNFQETFLESRDPGRQGLPLLPPGSAGAGGAYPLEIPSGDSGLPAIRKGDVGAFEVEP